MKNLMNTMILSLILLLSLTACGGETVAVESKVPNSLSDSEKDAGWKLLFDGK